jgi:hypothetical protein
VDALVTYAFHSLAGYRGLLIYNPPVLIGVAGLVVLMRSNSHRPFALALGGGLIVFLAVTILYTNNYSGETYGIRWHAMIAPVVVLAAGASAFVSSRQARRWWSVALVALALPGAALASIGTLNPWTTVVGDRPSFAEQFSDDPRYVETEIDRARSFLQREQFVEAIHYAEAVLRRDVSDERAWSIGIRAARRSKNQSKLDAFRSRLDRANVGPELSERVRTMLARDAEPSR